MRLSTMVGICMGVVALASGLMAERVITPAMADLDGGTFRPGGGALGPTGP